MSTDHGPSLPSFRLTLVNVNSSMLRFSRQTNGPSKKNSIGPRYTPLRMRSLDTSKDWIAGTGKYDPPNPALFKFALTFFVPLVYTKRHFPFKSEPFTRVSPRAGLRFSSAEMDAYTSSTNAERSFAAA